MHIEFLRKQFAHYQKNQTFDKNQLESAAEEDAISNSILTEKIRQDISGAGFEAAAISAAIDMENKSIEVYEQRARDSNIPMKKSCTSFWPIGKRTS